MPNVVRFTDLCTGHSCFPTRPNDEASPNVIVNGLGAHRQGDHWITHCCSESCHDGRLASGSATVIVNGRQLCRVGDPVDCGSKAGSTYSPDVIAGG